MGERQEAILRDIVENYISDFKPVSSKSLVDKFNVSSATIRNDMAELEELGFIEKEHTSSGRIPSEKGYRYYVENLMKPKEMNGEEVLKLQTILSNNSLVVSDAISKCMEIISDITHYTSVVIGDSAKNATLKQISIIPLDNNMDKDGYKKVVAVLVTNQGDVENKQVNVDGDIDLNHNDVTGKTKGIHLVCNKGTIEIDAKTIKAIETGMDSAGVIIDTVDPNFASNTGVITINAGEVSGQKQGILIDENDGTINMSVGKVAAEGTDGIDIENSGGNSDINITFDSTAKVTGKTNGMYLKNNTGTITINESKNPENAGDISGESNGIFIDSNNAFMDITAETIEGKQRGINIDKSKGEDIMEFM